MRGLLTISILVLVVGGVLTGRYLTERSAGGADATETAPAAANDQPADVRYGSELEAASAAYTKASSAIRAESDEKYAAAKAAYDETAKRSRDAYLQALEAELEAETKQGHADAAAAVKQKIDYLLNGPPRNEAQKLWSESYAAEYRQDYEAAIVAVEKLAQLTDGSKNAFVQVRLGWLRYLNGQYEQAEAAYKAGAALAPQAITPLHGLLNCNQALKRTDQAIETARGMLKLDPMSYTANKALGDLYYLKEDYARAGAHYQRLSAAYTEDLTMATNLGWCYLKLDQRSLALQIFGNVLAVQPDNAAAASGYAAASQPPAAKSETGAAKSAVEKIVIRNPRVSDRAVTYTLNDKFPVTLEPGRDQTLEVGRSWIIRFEQNGPGSQIQYRLKAGQYDFVADGSQWKLLRR